MLERYEEETKKSWKEQENSFKSVEVLVDQMLSVKEEVEEQDDEAPVSSEISMKNEVVEANEGDWSREAAGGGGGGGCHSGGGRHGGGGGWLRGRGFGKVRGEWGGRFGMGLRVVVVGGGAAGGGTVDGDRKGGSGGGGRKGDRGRRKRGKEEGGCRGGGFWVVGGGGGGRWWWLGGGWVMERKRGGRGFREGGRD
nr:acanthoscurrin-1-like [Arachis hypogaea]